MPETPVPANAAEGVKKIWKNENLSLSCPFLEVNHAENLLPGLLDGMVVVLHLLREKLLKPFILVYVLIDEPDGLLTVDFDSRLTRLAIVEPCLGPPSDSAPVRIDTHHSWQVETLDVDFQFGERVDESATGYGFVIGFFFNAWLMVLRKI